MNNARTNQPAHLADWAFQGAARDLHCANRLEAQQQPESAANLRYQAGKQSGEQWQRRQFPCAQPHQQHPNHHHPLQNHAKHQARHRRTGTTDAAAQCDPGSHQPPQHDRCATQGRCQCMGQPPQQEQPCHQRYHQQLDCCGAQCQPPTSDDRIQHTKTCGGKGLKARKRFA